MKQREDSQDSLMRLLLNKNYLKQTQEGLRFYGDVNNKSDPDFSLQSQEIKMVPKTYRKSFKKH